MIEPRVRDIIEIYKLANIQGVNAYLTDPDMIVDPSTWSGKLKEMIDKKNYYTAKATIEIIAYKFKYKNNGES